MRKLYTLITLLVIVSFTFGCRKDVLKSYDRRIIGNWKITDINKFGIGSSGSMPFSDGGEFTFADGGQLTYNYAGKTHTGSWDIRNEVRDDETIRSLQLTAVNFTDQEVLSDFFNEIVFTGTNRFKAFIYSGSRTYVYHFLRE